MMARRGLIVTIPALFAGLALLGCGGPQAAEGGVLAGTVSRGSACPATGLQTPCPPAPAPNVGILVSTSDGREIQSVVTDDKGDYRTDLPPGTYRVEMTSLSGSGLTEDLPATVTVTKGQQTRLDVSIEAVASASAADAVTTVTAAPAPTGTAAPTEISTPPPTLKQQPPDTPTPVPPSTPIGVRPPAGMGLLAGRVTK